MKTLPTVLIAVAATFAVVQLSHAQSAGLTVQRLQFDQLCDTTANGQLTAHAQTRGREGFELVGVFAWARRIQERHAGRDVFEAPAVNGGRSSRDTAAVG